MSIERTHPIHTDPIPTCEQANWLSAEEYLLRRNEFINVQFDLAMGNLQQDAIYAHNPSLLSLAAPITLRTMFAAKYIDDQHLAGSPIPVSIQLTRGLKNPHLAMTTAPTFAIDAEEVSLTDVIEEQLADIQIHKFVVYVNMNALDADIAEIVPIAMNPLTEQDFEVCIDGNEEELELLAVEMESYMVEEMAHVMYILRNATNIEGLRLLKDVFMHYKGLAKDENHFFKSEEEYHHYRSSLIERDATLWVRSFLNQHYPDVDSGDYH